MGGFIWWDSEPRRQHLSSPEKTAPRRQEVESDYIQVCNKGSRQSEHQGSDIKLRNFTFCVWNTQAHYSFVSCAPQLAGANPVSLFALRSHRWLPLASPSSLAVTMEGVAEFSGSQFGERSFTFGGQESLMAVIFLVYRYGRRYLHFTPPIIFQDFTSSFWI